MAFLWLPEARRVEHDRGLTFTDTGEPKGVLHTTESSGRPSYNGWSVHPHLTVVPKAKVGVDVDQHIPFNHAGMALRNLAGGAQTNRDRAFQVELVGTSALGGPGYYWAAADDKVLLDLWRKVIHPMSVGLTIPVKALEFQAYPSSYGDRRPDGRTNMVRLSAHEWDAYSGWCGHQHVPENIHGDPGAFPWARMIRLAEAAGDVSRDEPRVPPRPAPKVTLSRYLREGCHGEDVKAVQRVVGTRVDGDFGPKTEGAVKTWQSKRGLAADGVVGPKTAARMGFGWKG